MAYSAECINGPGSWCSACTYEDCECACHLEGPLAALSDIEADDPCEECNQPAEECRCGEMENDPDDYDL